jgi:hypothetical protein
LSKLAKSNRPDQQLTALSQPGRNITGLARSGAAGDRAAESAAVIKQERR